MASQPPPQGAQGQPQIQFQFPPGQSPTQEQIAAMRRQLDIDAKKNNMSVPEFINKIKEQQRAQAGQQGGQPPAPQQQQQQQTQQAITPGPPKPEALAVANFLKGQDLKMRTCILNGQRKDMFKGKDPSSSPRINSNRSP
jgi:translocation protein SEC62